jgi:hypothetical protein
MPRPRPAASALSLALTLTLLLAACGGDDEAAAPASTGSSEVGASTSTTTSPEVSTSTSTTVTSATALPATTVPAGPEADVVLEVVVEAGSVIEGGGRESVPIGSTVALVVMSDVAEEIHLHGYDVELAVEPGVPAVLGFAADIPGVFEVELHGSGLGLWDLEIS